ncbi:MAG: LytTR family DNA-binding domain-containing protein [Lachnospiraceae bacterium]|nr:LytTR family DNA-binding domain-containing protein [Lachnospiraceae bacterium]
MLMIAVCDDEVRECLHLSKQIQTVLEELNIPHIIKQYNSGQQLLQASEEFDIVFLDIIMSDVDGLQTAKTFRRNFFDKILIFVSSSRQYVFDVFELEAFEYLVKPIDTGKLRRTLLRCVSKTNQSSEDYIIISKDRQTRKLFLDEIRYFEIHGRLIEAHGKNPVFSWYEQIGTLETMLLKKDFFRCHKSYLINLKYVDVYNKTEATLDNGEKILIAKRRYESFCTAMLEYMRKSGGITTL